MALAECSFQSGGLGLDVSLPAPALASREGIALAAALFGEMASCVIVSADESNADTVLARAAAVGVPASVVGVVGGARYKLAVDGSSVIDVPVAEIERIWETGLSHHFEPEAA